MDVCAKAFKAAAQLFENGALEAARAERYAGWNTDDAKGMLANGDLESISERVLATGMSPEPASGRQERLENLVNRFL
jgi:xylose isomerase